MGCHAVAPLDALPGLRIPDYLGMLLHVCGAAGFLQLGQQGRTTYWLVGLGGRVVVPQPVPVPVEFVGQFVRFLACFRRVTDVCGLSGIY